MTRRSLAELAESYRLATAEADRERKRLYEGIRRAAAEGRSYRSIAAEVGLAFTRVQQIVKG